MRTDIPDGVAADLLTGNIVRYARIDFNDGDHLYIAQFKYNVMESMSGAFGRAPFGRTPFASSTPGTVTYTEPIVSSWGSRTFSGNPSAAASGDIIPTIERQFSLVNTEDTGWIGQRVIDGSLVGAQVTFYVRSKTTNEQWIEDILIIVEPLSLSSTACDISITAVSTMLKYSNSYVGAYNAATGEYDNILLGKLDIRIGEDDSVSSSPYTTISSTAAQGDTSIQVPSNATDPFPDSGVLFINGDQVPYSSKTATTFVLSSPLPRQHDEDSFVGVYGGSYYYKYGVGPITVGGEILEVNGEEYENAHTIITASNPVKISFPNTFPYRLLDSISEYSSNYTVGEADFAETGGWIGTGFIINDTVNYTGRQELAHTDWIDLGDEITIPEGVDFVSVSVRIQINLYKYSSGETSYKTTSSFIDADDLGPFVNLTERVPGTGFIRFSDNVGSPYNTWVDAVSAVWSPLSAPAGYSFDSGSVRFTGSVFNADSSHSLVMVFLGSSYVYTYSSTTTTDYQKEIDVTLPINSYNPNDVNWGVKYRWYATGPYTNGDLVGLFEKYSVTINWKKQTLGVAYGIASAYIFGQAYEWKASSGDMVVDKEFTSTNINDIGPNLNKIIISAGSTLADGETRVFATVSSIRYSIKYSTNTIGYPKYEVVAPEDTRLTFADSGEDVNPVDVMKSVLFRAQVPATYGDSVQVADDLYTANNQLCNGYFQGNMSPIQALREISRQCSCVIFEQAGAFELIRKRIKELVPATERVILGADAVVGTVSDGIDIELQSVSDIVNSLDCSYNADYTLTYSGSISYSFVLPGSVLSQGQPLLLSLIDDANFAAYVLQTAVQRNCVPGLIITIKATPEAAKVNFGDIVDINLGGYCGLTNIAGEVVSVATDYEDSTSKIANNYRITLFCLGSAVSAGQKGSTEDIIDIGESTIESPEYGITEDTIKVNHTETQDYTAGNSFASRPFGRGGFASTAKTTVTGN